MVTRDSILLAPTLSLHGDVVQEYWQLLDVYGFLEYRLCDIKDPKWMDVVDMIKRIGNQMYSVVDVGSDAILGEFVLENFTGKSAQIHFSFRPEDITFKDRIFIGKYVLDFIFNKWVGSDDIPFLDSVFGLTPSSNRAAILVALKCGFKRLGILPSGINSGGKAEDAIITVACR